MQSNGDVGSVSGSFGGPTVLYSYLLLDRELGEFALSSSPPWLFCKQATKLNQSPHIPPSLQAQLKIPLISPDLLFYLFLPPSPAPYSNRYSLHFNPEAWECCDCLAWYGTGGILHRERLSLALPLGPRQP